MCVIGEDSARRASRKHPCSNRSALVVGEAREEMRTERRNCMCARHTARPHPTLQPQTQLTRPGTRAKGRPPPTTPPSAPATGEKKQNKTLTLGQKRTTTRLPATKFS